MNRQRLEVKGVHRGGAFLWNAVRMALQALLRWPLRAGLTSLGILVGVFAVTVTVALGDGARAKVSSQIDNLGSNALLIQPEDRQRTGARRDDDKAFLKDSDAEAIKVSVPSAQYVAPLLMSREQIVYRGLNTTAEVIGTNQDFLPVRAWPLARGRSWEREEENTGARVCVIGQSVREELFGAEDPIGHVVRLGRHPFRVIGMLAPKGQDPFGRDEDARVLMPLQTARSKLRPNAFEQVDAILVGAESESATARTVTAVTLLIRERHGLLESAPSDFRIQTQQEFKEAQGRIMEVLNLLLVSIAVVSLVVGGIGIMNIMLVSVSERRREIGIRLSVGARARDIMLQFLVEACVLSLIGGGLGALAAAAAVSFLSGALGIPMFVSPSVLGLALVTSSLIGVLFGFFPARRAARLDPIVALGQD